MTPLQHMETERFIETPLSTKQKSYMTWCLLAVAQDLKRKKKKKKEMNKTGKRKEEVTVGGSSPLIPDVVRSCSGVSL